MRTDNAMKIDNPTMSVSEHLQVPGQTTAQSFSCKCRQPILTTAKISQARRVNLERNVLVER